MAFPIAPNNGQVATVNGITYIYNTATSSWTRSSIILPSISVIVDTFVSDGSTLAFNLSVTPTAKEFISVNIDGVLQQKTAYSLLTNSLTLTGTPVSGAIIEVKTTVASPLSVITGLVFDSFTGDGVTTQFTLSTAPTSKYFTIVTIGGVVQQKANYSVTNNVLTFSTTPPNTAPVEVITFGPAVSASLAAGSNTQVQFNSSGSLGGSSNFTFDNTSNILTVTGNIVTTGKLLAGLSSTSLVNPISVFSGSGVTYDQVAIINSLGTGSADYVTYGNNGDDTQSWTDIGFTGNTFSDPNYTVTSAGDGYLFVQGNTSFGGNLVIATGNTGTTKDIIFATGGFQTGNIKARLYNSNGAFSVSGNIIGGNLVTTGTLSVGSASFTTATLGNATVTSNLAVNGWTTLQQSTEIVNILTGATGVVVHDVSIGSTYYHTSPAANFTVNFTNVPTTDGRVTVVSLIVVQGSTPYVPNAVQIAGTAQTIKWIGSSAPSGTASKTDVVTFSLLRISGAWVVYGQYATYG